MKPFVVILGLRFVACLALKFRSDGSERTTEESPGVAVRLGNPQAADAFLVKHGTKSAITMMTGVKRAPPMINQVSPVTVQPAYHGQQAPAPPQVGQAAPPPQDGQVTAPPQLGQAAAASGTEVTRIIFLSMELAFGVLLACIICAMIYILVKLFRQYLHVKNQAEDASMITFDGYFKYRFAYWVSWHGSAKVVILFCVVVCVLLVGAITYFVTVKSEAGAAFYRVFVWLVAPDGGLEETAHAGHLIGGLMSVLGLFIFALMMTMVQDTFASYMVSLKEGHAPVYECGHTVVIGITTENLHILDDLFRSKEGSGGTTFVILSTQPKIEIEHAIRHRLRMDLRGSTVVVRTGLSHNIHDLRRVSVDMCATCILLPSMQEEAESRDSYIVQSLVSICSMGWPIHGRILTVCTLPRNFDLVRRIGGSKLDVVMPEEFICKLLLECSRELGLGSIVSEVLRFDDTAELYVVEVPELLLGVSVQTAKKHYPAAILIGLMDEDDPDSYKLVPDCEHKLQKNDRLIFLAGDELHCLPTAHPVEPPTFTSSDQAFKRVALQKAPPRKETVFVFGWNRTIGTFLLDLDTMVSPDSAVVLLNSTPVDEQKARLVQTQHRRNRKFVNITNFHHVEGKLGSRYQLEHLPVQLDKGTRIFILADEDTDAHRADALALTSVLQISDLMAKCGHSTKVPIVPEVLDPLSERLCRNVSVHNFINSVGLSARFLAAVYNQPSIRSVLFDLISPGGKADIFIRSIESYLPQSDRPTSLSFGEATSIIGRYQDVLIGWTEPVKDGVSKLALVVSDSEDDGTIQSARSSPRRFSSRASTKLTSHREGFVSRLEAITGGQACPKFVLCPDDKTSRRPWSMESDKVAVLARSQ
jgi:hypothetical protein